VGAVRAGITWARAGGLSTRARVGKLGGGVGGQTSSLMLCYGIR
jgi:hypothetical protein